MNGGHTFDEELLEDHLDDVNSNEENDLNSALASADEAGTLRMSMSTKKNNVFNAVMDDEMLTLLQEQIEMGKKGDRGFKEEAYNAVASAMIENPVSKRVVVDEALWNTWLEGYPTSRLLKTKSIDYEKMGLVCGNDMATGQFARSSKCDSKGGGTSGESSSKKKEVRKRARDVEVLVTGMKESAALVQHALDNLADSIKNSEPHKRIGDEVYKELVKIEGLTRDDIDVTHEYLTLRKEMAAVFLLHGDKKEWIPRSLHRIHAASFP
ncbi:hypothetical protein MRB53_019171 [Persea americana]|uniref:Uncharacterized protein n=1 Tax=Persea americana TaxID=3435 RepID=A0ACC2KXB6_PERAE|nr:hypothetical protein MRB53_019171 [Persea americana]